MNFLEYNKNNSDLINESFGAIAAGGLLFAAILRELTLKTVPIYITKNTNIMPASRSAYQRLMDKFAVGYKEFLNAKKAGTNDLIDKVTGKKVHRNKMKDYKEKYNGTSIKKAYKGIVKKDGGKLGNYNDIRSAMVYKTNTGGTVTFINTEEAGKDRYFVIMDNAAEKFFIKNQGSTISSYISKYNDRNYNSPGVFGGEDTDKAVKYYDDYMARDKARQMRDKAREEVAPPEDSEFKGRVSKHYKDLLAKNVARDLAKSKAIELAKQEDGGSIDSTSRVEKDKYDIKNMEPDSDSYWVIRLKNSHDYQLLLSKLDQLKNNKEGPKFIIRTVQNLKGQSSNRFYQFNDGSIVKLYYSIPEREYRMEFSSDAAIDNAERAGFFSIEGLDQNLRDSAQAMSKK